MAELPAALATALRGQRPLLFGAVEILLPGYDLCLLDGAARVPIGTKTFVGRDATYGVLDSVKGLSEKIGDQAQAVTLGLIPAGDAALAALIDPGVQGSAVTISLGCLDMATGLPVSDLYMLFAGELDVPTIKWGQHDRRLEYKVTGIGERLFVTEEGRRLSDSFHQTVWPGELGLGFVTGIEDTVPWGQQLNTSVIETRTNLPAFGTVTYERT